MSNRDKERPREREIDREGKRMKERYRQITDGNPSMTSDMAEVQLWQSLSSTDQLQRECYF